MGGGERLALYTSGDTTPYKMTGDSSAILHGVVPLDSSQCSAEAVRRAGVHARVALENLLGRGVQDRGLVLDESKVCHKGDSSGAQTCASLNCRLESNEEEEKVHTRQFLRFSS